MNANSSMLHDLIDMLEDGRSFYDEAAQSTTDGSRTLYLQKTHHYAAALDDIRDWIVRSGKDGGARDEDFNALLERVYASLRDEPRVRTQPAMATAQPHATDRVFANELE